VAHQLGLSVEMYLPVGWSTVDWSIQFLFQKIYAGLSSLAWGPVNPFTKSISPLRYTSPQYEIDCSYSKNSNWANGVIMT